MIDLMNASAQIVYRGSLLAVETLSWNSSEGRPLHRDVVRHPGAVLVIPLLPDDRLVLVGNFRVAVDERLWELPAGTLEPPEPPETAALRELEEETGYRAGRIEPLGSFYTSPGFCDELMRVFVARDLVEVGQRLEPHEDIETRVFRLDELLSMIDAGTMRDGKSIAAILLWLGNKAAGANRGRR